MDENELIALSKEIGELHIQAESAEQTVSVMVRLSFHLGRLVSHTLSEQRQNNQRAEKVQLLDEAVFGDRKNRLGLTAQFDEFRKYMEAGRRLHYFVATCALGLVMKALWELIAR